MKTITLFDFFDQKKLISHLGFLVFSLIISFIWGVYRGNNTIDLISVFLMIFFQIEVFIYLGNILFGELNFDLSPGEITKIVILRFLIFIAACLIVSLVLYLGLKFLIRSFTGGDLTGLITGFFRDEWHVWFLSTIKGLTLGAAIFVILLWQASLRREQKLREENLIFQNETLRNQVNPHFLFNSLNTISSLMQTDPPKAERFLNNLSNVYRYILENAQKDRISLQSELDLINSYFDLHRVRDEEKIMLDIDYTGSDDFLILPVSLQILLENAIKHNIATRENPLRISIFFEGGYIVVKNTLQRKATQIISTKIGLRNLSERVKLVSGKELIIEETDKHFIVKLPLLK